MEENHICRAIWTTFILTLAFILLKGLDQHVGHLSVMSELRQLRIAVESYAAVRPAEGSGE